MIPFQMVFVPLSLLVALRTALRARRGVISYRQGVLWTLVWVTVAVLILWPSFSAVVASWLGIGRGSDLVFYLAILAGLWMILNLHNSHRRLERDLTILARRFSLESPIRGGQAEENQQAEDQSP